ncbi:MAG: ATP-binding protein [Lachnospiraceae bacterium]|nr:ATP-binding protein [Lachnospiraceae bacterium]
MGNILKELVVEATLDNLDKVTGFLEENLMAADCPMKTTMKILVSVEEVYVNVSSYAYGKETGKCTILLEIETNEDNGLARITIKDKGKAFNPLEQEDPDITLKADDRPIGGLGILMVKKSMDKVDYKYLCGENILVVEKIW